MAVLVTDPIIHIRIADRTRAAGLHEVLFHAHSGTLIDLSGMRADQRAPVVTALAIISHLLRRYSRSLFATPDDWLKALRSQFGEDALVLAGGPHGGFAAAGRALRQPPRNGPGREISSEIKRMGREPDLPRRRCS
jgi:hypothetical protein